MKIEDLATTKPCLIRGVRAQWGCLGNMSPHAVRCQLNDFARAEMLFQALRFDWGGKVWRELHAETNPMKSKFIAKANVDKMLIEPRGEIDVNNMRMVIALKFEQHVDVREAIVATDDRLIIEYCSKRQTASGLFWGAALQPDGSWNGQNMLGVLWMEHREKFFREFSGA